MLVPPTSCVDFLSARTQFPASLLDLDKPARAHSEWVASARELCRRPVARRLRQAGHVLNNSNNALCCKEHRSQNSGPNLTSLDIRQRGTHRSPGENVKGHTAMLHEMMERRRLLSSRAVVTCMIYDQGFEVRWITHRP